MVGMRDVAREAGVSTSTVSLVVNGNGYVSDEMVERVNQAMSKLNYVPNELARNFSRNQTNLVGVIVPTIRHPFFATLTASLQRALYENGLRTALCSTADVDQDVSQYVDMLRSHAMDGIIMGAHAVYPADYWSSIDRPIVAFDRFLGDVIPFVGSDHSQGGRLAADVFVKTGARHVVEIGGPRTRYQTEMGDRSISLGSVQIAGRTTFPPIRYHLAFEQVMKQAGIRYSYIEIENVEQMKQFRDAATRAFEQYSNVDAIVAPDLAAAFCVQEALRRGKNIPVDVQIISYDGTYVSDLAGLKLTSIKQDFDAIADVLAKRMVQSISCGSAQDGKNCLIDGSINEDEEMGANIFVESGELIPMTLDHGESTR